MTRAILIAATVVWAGFAQAQVGCRVWSTMKDYLAERHKEVPVGVGLTNTRSVLVLFVGPKSWTLVRRRAGGPSCLVEAGSYWWPAGPKPTPTRDIKQ